MVIRDVKARCSICRPSGQPSSRVLTGWLRGSLCFVSPPCIINQRNKRNVDAGRASRVQPRTRTRFRRRMYNLIPRTVRGYRPSCTFSRTCEGVLVISYKFRTTFLYKIPSQFLHKTLLNFFYFPEFKTIFNSD